MEVRWQFPGEVARSKPPKTRCKINFQSEFIIITGGNERTIEITGQAISPRRYLKMKTNRPRMRENVILVQAGDDSRLITSKKPTSRGETAI